MSKLERVAKVKEHKRNWMLKFILRDFPDTMYFRSFYNETTAKKYLIHQDVKYQLITHI